MHCQQPIPDSEAGSGFCCTGCRAAYSLIRGEGLEEYYALRERMKAGASSPVDVQWIEQSFVDLDAPRFWSSHVVALPGGNVQCTLHLHGIHCAACVWLLEKLPQIRPGILQARVNMGRNTIEFIWDPGRLRLSEIAQQIAKLGYRAVPLNSSSQERAKKQQQRQQLIQIAIAGACSGNVMLLALAIYAGEWTGIAAEHLQLLRIASGAVGLVSLLGPGSLFFRGAWAALLSRTPHMDLPIALGLGVGAVSGTWNTLIGHGELYFDSLSMLVFLLLVGRALQSRQQQHACESVDLLQQLTPGTAMKVIHGVAEPIAIEEIQVGDTLEVRSGQTIPADGKIILGNTEVDASLLTGESLPRVVNVGDEVIAGTLNRSRTIRMTVQRVGENTRLGALVESIHQASLLKAPVVQWADRVSGIFVVVVISLAVIVGIAWWWIDREVWSERVISLLIVACPCALGLATPLAIAVGLGRSAKRGVLIKGGDTLQKLSKPGILVLDKTGTVTEGHMQVHHWSGNGRSLELAASLEKYSEHPIAAAICEYWSHRACGEKILDAEQVEMHLGGGVSGWVAGSEVHVGSGLFMQHEGIAIDDDFEGKQQGILNAGHTPILISIDRKLMAIAGVGDSIRREAKALLGRLTQRGWECALLSGDHPRIVAMAGETLGLATDRVFGGVSPEEKLEKIRQLKQTQRPVLMVGDGVNDAAALAAADIGIAVRGGAEVSMQAADVFLANGSLEGIEEIISTASRTMNVIRRNSIASLMYNCLAVSLAASGYLHPLTAALLMPVSSLTVVGVTLVGHMGRRSE